MLTVANVGRFLWDGMEMGFRKAFLLLRKFKVKADNGTLESGAFFLQNGEEKSNGEYPSLLVTAPVLLFIFLSYIIIGGFILPLWEPLRWSVFRPPLSLCGLQRE